MYNKDVPERGTRMLSDLTGGSRKALPTTTDIDTKDGLTGIITNNPRVSHHLDDVQRIVQTNETLVVQQCNQPAFFYRIIRSSIVT
jgi:hypothetical protein